MKRQLLTQMRNEWRSNIWIIMELAIVGVVTWSCFTLIVHLVSLRMQHYGYSTDNLYHAEVMYIPKESVSYKEYTDSIHNHVTDLAMIRSKLSDNPYVETTGLGSNSMPYNFNFLGSGITFTEADSTYTYFGNRRFITPAVVRMLKLEGFNGETTEQLAAMIEKGDIIVSNTNIERDDQAHPEDYIGKDVILDRDSTRTYRVGGTAYGIHRSDYEELFLGVIYFPLSSNDWGNEMIIEVKPDMGQKFIESTKASDLEHGNVYLSDLKSLDQMRQEAHHSIHTVVRNQTVCAVFLLLIIFLGFLGTFWFRIQQRTSEIAVRMVNGATRNDIFRRLLSEGFALLAISSLISISLEIAMIHYEVGNWGMKISSIIPWLAMICATAVLAIMITAGIWMPAHKAMNINPASALKDQ